MLMFSVMSVYLAYEAKDYAVARAEVVADLSRSDTLNPVVGFKAAMLLDPSNPEYARDLAKEYLEDSQPQSAYDLVKDESDPESAIVASYASLELDRGGESAKLKQWPDNKAAKEQLELISKIQTQKDLVIAKELYSKGLPETALRVAAASPASISIELLIAQIYINKPGSREEDIAKALEAVDRGLKIDASRTALHELKRSIYVLQDNEEGARAETAILERLQNGRL